MGQMRKRHVTAAEEEFCQHFVLHANKAAAYRHAYPERAAGRTEQRIAVAAAQASAKPHVQTRIAELRAILAAKVETKFEITSDWVLQRLAAIADATIDDFLDVGPDGLPRIDLTKANATARRGLVALKVKRTERPGKDNGGGASSPSIEIDVDLKITNDRLGALKLLGQHLQMFKLEDAPNVTVNFGERLQRSLERARARAESRREKSQLQSKGIDQ